MSTDNKEQKNGVTVDDKSKDACNAQGSGGESDAIVAEAKPATTSNNRGGVTIDDRSKGFEV